MVAEHKTVSQAKIFKVGRIGQYWSKERVIVVTVTYDEQQVLFKVGDVELIARLLEGKYPDYRKLIPASFAVETKLKKTDFTNITKVSSLFARESAGSVTLKVDETAGTLSIR